MSAPLAQPKRKSKPLQERVCSRCGTTKTPQWRAGSLGPNTLCNACGVKFKASKRSSTDPSLSPPPTPSLPVVLPSPIPPTSPSPSTLSVAAAAATAATATAALVLESPMPTFPAPPPASESAPSEPRKHAQVAPSMKPLKKRFVPSSKPTEASPPTPSPPVPFESLVSSSCSPVSPALPQSPPQASELSIPVAAQILVSAASSPPPLDVDPLLAAPPTPSIPFPVAPEAVGSMHVPVPILPSLSSDQFDLRPLFRTVGSPVLPKSEPGSESTPFGVPPPPIGSPSSKRSYSEPAERQRKKRSRTSRSQASAVEPAGSYMGLLPSSEDVDAESCSPFDDESRSRPYVPSLVSCGSFPTDADARSSGSLLGYDRDDDSEQDTIAKFFMAIQRRNARRKNDFSGFRPYYSG
ncbi:uncharacterized protein BJ171DRAFT_106908 [Polychytrium aggregatum]|uniref:uncharacterized protein n=1 Tax=Polychytrium aggregatum TaxID=110093 RepID=UPI0022FE8165|nr:uncharacterized protein BJ171DRAFT_106908 [Polychytrium aggregatum]KAI9204447.1 hypothetical protein BJ171DRAFT_106908 [Polychytrium aggregatum]